jgi:hypothetical protein
MAQQFIDVKKVSEVHARDRQNEIVINPQTGRKQVASLIIHRESISKDDIKSYRPWDKDEFQNSQLEGNFTMIYFKSTDADKSVKRPKPPQMLIQEDYKAFGSRIGSIAT